MVLEALVPRFTAIEPAGPPLRRANNSLNALAELPLRVAGAGR